MLTSWKQSQTSIEYPLHPIVESSAKKKNKKSSRKSLAAAASSIATSDIIGAQFVPQPVEPNGSSSRGNKKKRRKFNNNDTTTSGKGNLDTAGPTLCLTSPHRVVFMDKDGEGGISDADASANDGILLTESKSRNYITRPGATSSFYLRGDGQHDSESFAGILPTGAQYDPTSNLIYALRNGGSEVAIWTAAPSSTLPGPDDDAAVETPDRGISKVGKAVINGSKQLNTPMSARKRKLLSQQHQPGSSSEKDGGSLADETIVSQRLQLPGGKVAVTLTPFNIPASKAVGVSGCCDDGSIWAAIRFHQSGQFQLVTVDGSSMGEKLAKDTSSKSRRKSSSKAKAVEDTKGESWVLLDSRVTGMNSSGHDDSVLLSVQSVILSEGKAKAHVIAFRNHQVRIRNKDSDKLVVHVEKYTKQTILQIEATPPAGSRDIAAKLDAGVNSLSIVHKNKKNDDRWFFTSVDISQSNGQALLNTVTTFPLPSSDDGATTVFSFGKVGPSIVAMLMKKRQSLEQPCASVLSLRIIDFRRKAELSSTCWIEGDDSSSKDSVLNKMLHRKQCHGMITNENDGSIALLSSSKGSSSLDIVFSQLEQVNSTTTEDQTNAPNMVSTSTSSLASALRSAATSSASHLEAANKKSPLAMDQLSSDMAKAISSEVDAHQSVVDDAVDQACKLLATSANELIIELTKNSAENGSSTPKNGKSKNGSKGNKNKHSTFSWREVYHEGCAMISKAKEGKNMINGMLECVKMPKSANDANEMLPKRFVEAAFKETVTLLLSLHKAGDASATRHKEFQKTIEEVTAILVKILQTNLISARADYGLGSLYRENLFLSILQACPSFLSSADNGIKKVGKLNVMDAMLEHVQDISEGTLVSILRFVLRRVEGYDVVAYYSSSLSHETSSKKKGTRLSNQYKEMGEKGVEDDQERIIIVTKLLSEAVLDFTLKIVTYSNCNHSFLSKAMRDGINTSNGEVETLLLTLAKLLKLGSTRKFQEEDETDDSNQEVSPSMGTIHWISALTDAHMGTIIKMTSDGGGLVLDRIQRAVRSAMAQSEFANEVLQEISELIVSGGVSSADDVVMTKLSSITQPSSRDTAVVPYSIERLAF